MEQRHHWQCWVELPNDSDAALLAEMTKIAVRIDRGNAGSDYVLCEGSKATCAKFYKRNRMTGAELHFGYDCGPINEE